MRAPTACRRTGSGTISLPCSGCFSPFPHGTGSLSVSREYLALRDGPRSFTQDFSCPALLRIPLRFGNHSCKGLSPATAALSRGVPLGCCLAMSWSYNPVTASTATVWATPLSLATTRGIILIFSSYGYLDVSVPHVRPGNAGDGPPARRVAPFGHPRIKGYLLLPVAFRSLSRPSSPPRAKASTVCPCLLSARRTIKCGLIYLKLALLVFLLVYLLLMSNMSKIPFM